MDRRRERRGGVPVRSIISKGGITDPPWEKRMMDPRLFHWIPRKTPAFGPRFYRKRLLVSLLIYFLPGALPASEPGAPLAGNAPRTYSLTEVLRAASTQTLSISENQLGFRQLELGFESIRSEIYPRISVNSIYNVEYSGDTDDFRDHFTSTLNIYWNIFNLKNLLEKKKRAERTLQNAREEKERVIRKAIDHALGLYFECWIFRRDIETLEKELEYHRDLQQDDAIRLEKGLISREDFENSAVRIKDFEQKRSELQHGLEQARRRLKTFLRIRSSFLIAPPPKLVPPELGEFDAFFENALRHSDEFLHAENEIQNALESQKEQKWKRWKHFYSNFYFSDTVSLTESDWLERFDRFNSGASLSWRLPLLDAGDHRRNEEHSRIRYERALLKRDENENRFTEMLFQVWTALREAERRIALKEERIVERTGDVRFLESRYRGGTISRREFEKASLMLERARFELEKMHCDHIVQKAAFFHLCGQDTPWLYTEK